MGTKNYYHQLLDNETLQQEKYKLLKAYQSAIDSDLPFEKTKRIYMRLKQIKRQLDLIEQKNSTPQLKLAGTSQ